MRMRSYFSIGSGVLAKRLTTHLGPLQWLRSDTDICMAEGRAFVAQAVRSSDVVLVGVRPTQEQDPISFYGSAALLAQSLRLVACPVVLFGSSAVYGSSLCAQEDDAGWPTTPYGTGKWVEENLYRLCDRLLILRIFDTYGESRGVLSTFRQNLHTKRVPPVSAIHMDFLHLDDVAHLIALLIQQWLQEGARGHRVVNIGSGKATYLPALWASVSPQIPLSVPSPRSSCVASVSRMLTWVPHQTFVPMQDRDVRAYLLDPPTFQAPLPGVALPWNGAVSR